VGRASRRSTGSLYPALAERMEASASIDQNPSTLAHDARLICSAAWVSDEQIAASRPMVFTGSGLSFKHTLTGVVLTVILTTGARAGPLEDGDAAYERGDYATAVRLWRPLAEQGNPEAQFILGQMYNTGRGVSQDHAEAVKWYRRAAEQGDVLSQAVLGAMYGGEEGVPPDYVQSYMWSNLAASRASTQEDRNMALEMRNIVESKMTPEQIAEAQRLAREWKPKMAP
jgi:TPR repeat protein